MKGKSVKVLASLLTLAISVVAFGDEAMTLIRFVASSTQEVWKQEFQTMGRVYNQPRVITFSENISTACGTGSSNMGPFYCPLDETIYLDKYFFDELANRFQAPGDMAQAYVIAHEVGHHVQNKLGLLTKIRELQAANPGLSNQIQVRIELHADCLAGMWARIANAKQKMIEPGDIREVLNAARQIGDDNMQRRMTGTVHPDTFTHGTGDQRSRWFKKGIAYGKLSVCNEVFQALD